MVGHDNEEEKFFGTAVTADVRGSLSEKDKLLIGVRVLQLLEALKPFIPPENASRARLYLGCEACQQINDSTRARLKETSAIQKKFLTLRYPPFLKNDLRRR